MYSIKTPLVEFSLPSNWSEVTLRQYLNLFPKQTTADDGQPIYQVSDILRCLSSDANQVAQLTDGEQELLMQRLTFVGQQPDFSQLLQPVRLNGVVLPASLGRCTLLQKWTIEGAIRALASEGHSTDYINLSVPTLCIYLYPILTGKPLTSADQVDEVLSQVESLPVTTALPLSSFFLNRLTDLNPTGDTIITLMPAGNTRLPWPQRLHLSWHRLRYWYLYGRKETVYLKIS